ncbi:hypothetical protein MTR_8g102700 [Medicago truncatula]|uniref:Uncharacterized protein n=1 Tax=Medicago truncatula TaxID=3880 RepID=G7L7H6_MEDTR|nr:hypothetical protein MTR_8g102700 [Medicago truncatula]
MKAGFYPTHYRYFVRVFIKPWSNCHPYLLTFVHYLFLCLSNSQFDNYLLI